MGNPFPVEHTWILRDYLPILTYIHHLQTQVIQMTNERTFIAYIDVAACEHSMFPSHCSICRTADLLFCPFLCPDIFDNQQDASWKTQIWLSLFNSGTVDGSPSEVVKFIWQVTRFYTAEWVSRISSVILVYIFFVVVGRLPGITKKSGWYKGRSGIISWLQEEWFFSSSRIWVSWAYPGPNQNWVVATQPLFFLSPRSLGLNGIQFDGCIFFKWVGSTSN